MSQRRSYQASVIVPTHDHAALVDVAVASALRQTVANLEVIVVGDGVGDDTRAVLRSLMAADERVSFLDFAKDPRRGETHRDVAVRAARSDVVCYLCDDELLLADHVATMLELLADCDLAQSLPGHLNADGTFAPQLEGASLASGLAVDAAAVSLTGSAHRVASYRALPVGWRGSGADDGGPSLWQQFAAQPGLQMRTASRVTALRFPSHLEERSSWDPEHRRAELVAWRRAMAGDGWRARFDAHVASELSARESDEPTRGRSDVSAAKRTTERAVGGSEGRVNVQRPGADRPRRERLFAHWRTRRRA